MDGLMQDYPLVLTTFLERARRLYPRREIVTRMPEHAGGIHRYTYADAYARVRRLAGALQGLGVKAGDRVGTFGWNTYRHLEAYFAIPGIGAICHTLNIRLFPEQLVFIANHAEDGVVLIDEDLVDGWLAFADQLQTVRTYVVMGSAERARPETLKALAETGAAVLDYEEMLARAPEIAEWPVFPETTASFLCYTSGTTGDPKGVLYSHRALYLHSYTHVMADTHRISERDRVLPVVPMFHANAWGLPFSCAMVGAAQVFPGPGPTPAEIAGLIEAERVTFSAGVPTVWIGVLQHARTGGADLSCLDRVVCGGSAVPAALIRAFRDELGINVQQGYGMTETGPLATMCHVKSHLEESLTPEALLDLRARQGLLMPGLQMRVVGDDGAEVPWDGQTMGEICLRGPWIASGYYKVPDAPAFRDGWLRTGDVAVVDAEGYVQIMDRTKDLVKSGGEWISSVDLETKIMGHPKVLEAAVIGVPDPKWQERPLACVVPRPGQTVTGAEIVEFLTPLVAKWWLPDRVEIVEEIPKTSVGKFDKKVLRAKFAAL